jgi:hypothetical protein
MLEQKYKQLEWSILVSVLFCAERNIFDNPQYRLEEFLVPAVEKKKMEKLARAISVFLIGLQTYWILSDSTCIQKNECRFLDPT